MGKFFAVAAAPSCASLNIFHLKFRNDDRESVTSRIMFISSRQIIVERRRLCARQGVVSLLMEVTPEIVYEVHEREGILLAYISAVLDDA